MALKPCPHCGHPISEQAEKCPQCHHDPRISPEELAHRQEAEQARKKAQQKRARLIGGICAAVVLAAAGICAALFLPAYQDYRAACDLLEQQKYVEAAEAFDAMADYRDSAQQALEARYQYVSAHRNRDDRQTREYLSDLLDAKYKDAASIEDEIYAWRITAFPCASKVKDHINEKYWFGTDETLYFFVEAHGGKFGEKLSIDYRFDFYVSPYAASLGYSDDVEYGSVSSKLADGDDYGIGWGNGIGTARYSTVKITFYNAETNALLATSEVHIYS